MAARPFGALPADTGEYMLGDIAVTVVLMESTGASDSNTENWTPALIQQVKNKVQQGLGWWVDTLQNTFQLTEERAASLLNFIPDWRFADSPVPTPYEPIARRSDDHALWVEDFLNFAGTNTSAGLFEDIRSFNDAQRLAHNADWAFTMFVANDAQDIDKKFQPGGSFDQAFAYPGGLFLVTPASRPVSTYAHETAHMFWAKDEYETGYASRRGYYNTQNANAADNPTPGFVQQPSIMAGGSLVEQAFAAHTSSRSSLEMIGWRDSDGDGIMDVLDVPHRLTGRGAVHPQTGDYRFQGNSTVATLPNRNPLATSPWQLASLQNDITINRIRRAEYRIDQGAWVTAASYNAASVDLDLSIPLTPGFHTIEIRTVDDRTGVTSSIFIGTTDSPAATTAPGINGFIWNDADADGIWDANEYGLNNWTVMVRDGQGNALPAGPQIEPDDHPTGTTLNNIHPDVRLTAQGAQVGDGAVSARACGPASTGQQTFQHRISTSVLADCQVGWSADWSGDVKLHIDLKGKPTSVVRLDAISNAAGQYGRLEIYDSANNLLARHTTAPLRAGQVETMTLSRPTADIAYALAYGHLPTTSAIRFDNLRIGPGTTVASGAGGEFALGHLAPGDYQVELVVPAAWRATTPSAAQQTVTVAGGAAVAGVNFGVVFAVANWQNPRDPLDVSGEGTIAPLDALLVINELNRAGARMLDPPQAGTEPPPYLDVNGDGMIAPIDALLVINALNARPAAASLQAEAEPAGGPAELATSAKASSSRTSSHAVGAVAQDAEAESPAPLPMVHERPECRGVLGAIRWKLTPLEDLLDDLAADVAASGS